MACARSVFAAIAPIGTPTAHDSRLLPYREAFLGRLLHYQEACTSTAQHLASNPVGSVGRMSYKSVLNMLTAFLMTHSFGTIE